MTWRFSKRVTLAATECDFVAVPKRGNRATNCEVRAYDGASFVELGRCFTKFGAERCTQRLEELLFCGRVQPNLSPTAQTSLRLCIQEREKERETDRIGWMLLLCMTLGFLTLIGIGLLSQLLGSGLR